MPSAKIPSRTVIEGNPSYSTVTSEIGFRPKLLKISGQPQCQEACASIFRNVAKSTAKVMLLLRVNSGGMAIRDSFVLWLLFSTLSRVQVIDSNIDFTQTSIWKGLKTCVQDCFISPKEQETSRLDVQDQLGCTTDSCLCRADTLGQGLKIVSSIALAYCSDYQDVTAAESVLLAYCASAGFTIITAPVNAAPGQSTVTITVTVFITVYTSNEIQSASPLTEDLRVTIILTLAFLPR
jgi:hypothetical protein